MPILSAKSRVAQLPLSRPYSIAYRTISDVEIVLVELRDDEGRVGLGAASPSPHVTGESRERCRAALSEDALRWLVGKEVRSLPAIVTSLEERLPDAPAARAAVDMALHDLHAQRLGAPLCDVLGRCHEALPTSITIGIKEIPETIAEADEYIGRGFRVLKVKIGRALDEDVARLARLRAHVGPDLTIRVDANQGYSFDETRRFFAATADLALELVEQPVPAAATGQLRALDAAARARVAADEGVHGPADALSLVRPEPAVGIFNIKLMKCGGVRAALQIAAIAQAARLGLMWGCMDESAIGIAAALHAALACPATRYLDLDGSLDLARDVAGGGFVLDDGWMRPSGAPGLGVKLLDF